jgi:hypothetical protein
MLAERTGFSRLERGCHWNTKFMRLHAKRNILFRAFASRPARALIVAGFLFALLSKGHAFSFDPGGGGTNSSPTYTPLDSWSFRDSTTGRATTWLRARLVHQSCLFLSWQRLIAWWSNTNLPAWLQFNVVENDGTTNLTVDTGTVTFWFAPGNWSSTNAGGTGPGEYGRLLEVGSYTPDSSYGLWSIYVDDVGAEPLFLGADQRPFQQPDHLCFRADFLDDQLFSFRGADLFGHQHGLVS